VIVVSPRLGDDIYEARRCAPVLARISAIENAKFLISNRPGAVRPGSSGQVVPGCDCRLLNEENEVVTPGEIGTLWMKHDAACSHYWNQHQRTKDTIHGQWLSTGDKYRQDAEGYFWYAGRADDMLKVSGVWVSPIEVEAVLMEHDLVAEAAVVGCKDKDDLVKPVAWVVLRENLVGTPELARALQAFVVSRLPVYKRPRWVEFTSALPKTATGKIQRYRLRENYAPGDSQDATVDGVDASCADLKSGDHSPALHRFTEDLRLPIDQDNTKSS
jgi:acyl-coenzyme A synthetase/AMP-(fatty) acid ligase